MAAKEMLDMTAKQAKKQGYCITSRKPPVYAARIDRKDWREVMEQSNIHPSADLYRRCISKDVIVVPRSWIKVLPNSSSVDGEYCGN